MFVGLTNTPRDYAWGSTTAIADLLGRPRSGAHEAEYWLGTHPGSPSLIRDPDRAGRETKLSELTTLPFLLKILAADAPLSLQAHPTSEQALAGFERENALGIPLDAPERNYRDTGHKPELIYALSAQFAALCGFRPVAATVALLAALGDDPVIESFRARLVDDSSLRPTIEWLLSGSAPVDALVRRVVERSRGLKGAEFEMVDELAAVYPGDPGIVVALLLNRVVLSTGEALYLPAGNIHAYLSGVGVELMASSDNVLRGGLTLKHVDVAELLRVLDFRPAPADRLVPALPSPGVRVFRPDVPDFELAVIEPADGPAVVVPAGESIALCTNGSLRVNGKKGKVSLSQGDSVYVTSDESALTVVGSGTLFLASVNSAVVADAERRNEKNL
jgi:mannose-6-phosphate isomerase